MHSAIQTRNESFFRHRDSGALNAQQTKIMLAIHAHPGRDWSLRELGRATGLEINAVSGRCTELKAIGYLDECPPRSCSVSGRTITPVRASRGQRELFA
jgi:DNA-binding MarR family transcriptional regulator